LGGGTVGVGSWRVDCYFGGRGVNI
jgi:hypothetical protein